MIRNNPPVIEQNDLLRVRADAVLNQIFINYTDARITQGREPSLRNIYRTIDALRSFILHATHNSLTWLNRVEVSNDAQGEQRKILVVRRNLLVWLGEIKTSLRLEGIPQEPAAILDEYVDELISIQINEIIKNENILNKSKAVECLDRIEYYAAIATIVVLIPTTIGGAFWMYGLYSGTATAAAAVTGQTVSTYGGVATGASWATQNASRFIRDQFCNAAERTTLQATRPGV
ncbi:MAG: hypothetical protein JSS53_01945 [Proteobacteria bacterium]|nr:hypothetical protein [Pseudomonadota bacterium]